MSDLTLKMDDQKVLNCRVAALIIRDGKVLFERGHSGALFLMGGRIQHFSESQRCLQRELEEELSVIEYTAELCLIYENFFVNPKKQQVHELGYVYRVETDQDIPLVAEDDGRTIYFEWVDIENLKTEDIRPSFVKDIHLYLDGAIHHKTIRQGD